MRKSTKSNFATILSTFIMVALVVFCVGFLAFYTEDFTTSMKTFSVKCNDDTIVADRDNYKIIIGKEYKFEINNTIDNITGKETSYSVDIVPNEVNDFEFGVDGVNHNFKDEKSLIDGFSVVGYDDYFVLTANKDMQNILYANYIGKTLSNVPQAFNSGVAYFRLVVSSKSDNVVININFKLISEK